MKLKTIGFLTLLGLMSLAIAACGTIGGSSAPPTAVADPQAAAAHLPQLNGYTVTGANSISDAISAAVGQGVDQLDNFVLQQTIARVDSFIQCYEDVGAVAANIYTQADLETVLGGEVPSVGAVAIVNQDRVRENLIACITSSNEDENFSAQSAPPTCQRSGSFQAGGDTFTYVYISNQPTFCADVQAHFNSYGS